MKWFLFVSLSKQIYLCIYLYRNLHLTLYQITDTKEAFSFLIGEYSRHRIVDYKISESSKYEILVCNFHSYFICNRKAYAILESKEEVGKKKGKCKLFLKRKTPNIYKNNNQIIKFVCIIYSLK